MLKSDRNKNKSKLFIEFRFRKHNDLIYIITLNYVDKNRLCILQNMQQKIFKLTHDQKFHAGFHIIYVKSLLLIYIKSLLKHLQIYIKHYFNF